MTSRGFCLVSQQIREKIEKGEIIVHNASLSRFSKDDKSSGKKKGWFEDESLERRVQPSSFEPTIGEEVFRLDSEHLGTFRPDEHQTVHDALLRLPRRQRVNRDISDGYELKGGHTWLLPIQERVLLKPGEWIRSSPKSSIGRIFPRTRIIADYTTSFDNCRYRNGLDKPLHLWLMVQPTAFDLIVKPGLSLNQLRFFSGLDCSLSQSEVIALHKGTPLLYNRTPNGKLAPAKPVFTDDGMIVNLDLTGRFTEGIVGLRALKNPVPIDLSLSGVYDPHEYFEPVVQSDGRIRFHNGERYLLASAGELHVPPDFSAELRRHYGIGAIAEWDQAGFGDNNFWGDLVGEVTFNEIGGISLSAGNTTPFSALEFFRTSVRPDKLYGDESTGSHYQEQRGPRVPKYFKPFDFARAAKHYAKLDKDVLVHDARVLNSFRQTRDGFEPIRPDVAAKLISDIQTRGFFHSRYDCEDDSLVLQAIPYTLLFGEDNNIFTYVRASKIQAYGDVRLFGKHSIGLGGHIIRSDGPDFVEGGMERETFGEEVEVIGDYSKPGLVGTIMAYDNPVDRVHFGLIYAGRVRGEVRAVEDSITSFGMKRFDDFPRKPELYETWSRILIPHLPLINRALPSESD